MAPPRSKFFSAFRKNLRSLPVFSDLTDSEISTLLKHAKIRSLDIDDFLFHEGDESDFFAVIIDGTLEIEKATPKGVPIQIATLSKNDALGEMALLDQGTRSASAIATAPATVFVLSRSSFDALVDKYPRCGVKLIRRLSIQLCANVRQTSQLLAAASDEML